MHLNIICGYKINFVQIVRKTFLNSFFSFSLRFGNYLFCGANEIYNFNRKIANNKKTKPLIFEVSKSITAKKTSVKKHSPNRVNFKNFMMFIKLVKI